MLRKKRYRVVSTSSTNGDGGDGALSGERGYLREAGNLLFHVSVLVVLVGFAYGQLFGFKGGVVTVVGQDFSNSLSQYDDFAPGRMFDPDDLSPLSIKVDDFHVKFLTSGPQMGQPESFDADITYRTSPDAAPQKHDLAVNHPLTVPGTSVFLVGHGYAPVVTVRDGNGKVAYQGPVVFLPMDASFMSSGVIKVPYADPEQLGFDGFFFPTYGYTRATGPFSQFPDKLDPVLSLTPSHGDLGLGLGRPQSVYSIDMKNMKFFPSADPEKLGPNARIKLSPGQTVQLPDGLGSIRFDGVDRWVKLQVSNSPGKGIALGGVLLGDRRPDGLVVHPPPTGVGARHPARSPRRRARRHPAYRGRAGWTRPQLGRRPRLRDRRARAARAEVRDPQGARVSTAEFAAFSDNAIMFASIVYVLAFLAHLTEWVFLRSVPVPDAERESALVAAGPTRLVRR